jgi:hypothetical protein
MKVTWLIADMPGYLNTTAPLPRVEENCRGEFELPSFPDVPHEHIFQSLPQVRLQLKGVKIHFKFHQNSVVAELSECLTGAKKWKLRIELILYP